MADPEAANQVLGAGEGLNKALEPDLSDTLLSHRPGTTPPSPHPCTA